MAYALRLAWAKLRARLRRGGPVVVPGESFLMRIAGEPHEEEAARKALLGK